MGHCIKRNGILGQKNFSSFYGYYLNQYHKHQLLESLRQKYLHTKVAT